LPALIFAVNMLVNSDHGDTFSFEEISEWLRDAGFGDIQTAMIGTEAVVSRGTAIERLCWDLASRVEEQHHVAGGKSGSH
jgi:hypothetical protein